MHQNNILSKKALEILEEGKICISSKELEQELRYAQIEVAYLKGLRRLEKNALMNKNQEFSFI